MRYRWGRDTNTLNSALADAAVGGWQLSTIIITQSGAPFTVVMDSATPSGGAYASWLTIGRIDYGPHLIPDHGWVTEHIRCTARRRE